MSRISGVGNNHTVASGVNTSRRALVMVLTLALNGCASLTGAAPRVASDVDTGQPAATTPAAATPLPLIQLPKQPDEAALIIQVGQQLQLPMRQPRDGWQLDFDPAYWQSLGDASPDHGIRLQALQPGSTELRQREQATAAGGPAARQFVYPIEIRQ